MRGSRRPVRWTATWLAVTALSGCSSDNTEPADALPDTRGIVTTAPVSASATNVPDTDDDPCSPSGSESIVSSLAVASQHGDFAAAAELFAEGENFEWFSATSLVEHFVTYDPMDLEERFRQRFRDGEQFELSDFNWNGPVRSGNINFDFEMKWTNPDPASGSGEAWGKGAIDCADAAIIVWSVAMKPLGPGPVQNS